MELVSNRITELVKQAEEQIKATTGVDVTLMINSVTLNKEPEALLRVIARALNRHTYDYKVRSRKREYVWLRAIAITQLLELFPRQYGDYKTIAKRFEMDHTTIMHGEKMAVALLESKDEEFIDVFNTVQIAINEWLTNTNTNEQ